ncbi:MAG TPA: nuclear transport factor 2 family protein [Bacteroidota bacterium]|nr:nuclear transport factor 2 family protein [Bacteroidota bacterium]
MKMKIISSVVFICSVLLFPGFLVAQAPLKPDKDAKVKEEIKKIEYELENLIMSGNADKYSSYLADDFMLINSAGGVVQKEPLIQALRKSGAANGDSLIPDNLTVRVYGETAVLNGHLTWKGTDNGQKLSLQSLFTKVFVKRKGKWQMVNNQGTPLLQRPAGQK